MYFAHFVALSPLLGMHRGRIMIALFFFLLFLFVVRLHPFPTMCRVVMMVSFMTIIHTEPQQNSLSPQPAFKMKHGAQLTLHVQRKARVQVITLTLRDAGRCSDLISRLDILLRLTASYLMRSYSKQLGLNFQEPVGRREGCTPPQHSGSCIPWQAGFAACIGLSW